METAGGVFPSTVWVMRLQPQTWIWSDIRSYFEGPTQQDHLSQMGAPFTNFEEELVCDFPTEGEVQFLSISTPTSRYGTETLYLKVR